LGEDLIERVDVMGFVEVSEDSWFESEGGQAREGREVGRDGQRVEGESCCFEAKESGKWRDRERDMSVRDRREESQVIKMYRCCTNLLPRANLPSHPRSTSSETSTSRDSVRRRPTTVSPYQTGPTTKTSWRCRGYDKGLVLQLS